MAPPKKGPWTAAEENDLITIVRAMSGEEAKAMKHESEWWTAVAERLHGQYRWDRSANSCKTKYAGIRLDVGHDERKHLSECIKLYKRAEAAAKQPPPKKGVAQKVARLSYHSDAPTAMDDTPTTATSDVAMGNKPPEPKGKVSSRILQYAGASARNLIAKKEGFANPYLREMAKLGTSEKYDHQKARVDAGDAALVTIYRPYLEGKDAIKMVTLSTRKYR